MTSHNAPHLGLKLTPHDATSAYLRWDLKNEVCTSRIWLLMYVKARNGMPGKRTM
jgi:hypothetical protein